MDCVICGGSYPRRCMEKMFLCDHTCCIECIKGYYRVTVAEIRDPSSLQRLTCCMEPVPILEDVKLEFFQYLGTKVN